MKLTDFDLGNNNNDTYLIEALFLYASIGILVADDQGNILIANPFIERQFGYSPDELKNQKIELLIPRRFHKSHTRHRESFSQHPEGRPMGLGMDLFGIRKDGTEFPVEISLGYYKYQERTFAIAFINDITPRKESEKKIKSLYDELETKVEERTHQLKETMEQLNLSKEELGKSLNKEKELNELKSRFVSTASHEFRTPLSTVLSSVYLLEKYTTTEDQPKRQKHIDRIMSSVHMLTDILNDFLSVGKIEEGKIMVRPTRFVIADHIKAIVNEIRSIQKEGQQIRYQHTGEPAVVLDPGLLKHIIINLTSNAIKFSPPHSAIDISRHNTAEQLTITVKDNGIGISKQDQEHLFERFFRAANASSIQGTGLGLHIVAKYVELMNGTISCRSEAEKGTEMTVTFTIDNTQPAAIDQP
jgi:PAS domain S-box-containing protein